MICPTYLYVITCGLITKQELLLNCAVVFKLDLLEKKNYNYLTAIVAVYEPCAAICNPYVPNLALIELGFYILAFCGFDAPNKFFHLFTQSSAISYNPTTKSEVINPIS
jgi:hypothetical protein